MPSLDGGHTPGHVFAALLAQALGPLAERHRHGPRLVDRAGLIGQPGEIGLEASPGRLHTLRRAGPPPPAITATSSGSWPSGAGSSRRPTASRWASGARNTLLVAGGRSPSRASWFGSTGLDQLRLGDRRGHLQQRLAREHDPPLRDCPHLAREAQPTERVEGGFVDAEGVPEPGTLVLVEAKALKRTSGSRPGLWPSGTPGGAEGCGQTG